VPELNSGVVMQVYVATAKLYGRNLHETLRSPRLLQLDSSILVFVMLFGTLASRVVKWPVFECFESATASSGKPTGPTDIRASLLC
jgi:hypothetical protein